VISRNQIQGPIPARPLWRERGGGVETEYYIPYTYTMEDKYIGLALALGGTFLIGSVHSISLLGQMS